MKSYDFTEFLVRPTRFTPSGHKLRTVSGNKNTHPGWGGYFHGTPDTIRTCDLQSRSLSLYPAELRAHIASKREAIIADFCCLVKRKLPGSSLFSGLAAKPGACGTNAGLFVTRYKSEPDLRLSTCRRPCRPVLRQPPLRRQPGDRACRRPEIRSSGRTKRWTLRSPERFS